MIRYYSPNTVTKTLCDRVRVDIATMYNRELRTQCRRPWMLGGSEVSLSIEDGVRDRFRNLTRNLADKLALKYSDLRAIEIKHRLSRSLRSRTILSSLKSGGQVQLIRGILASFAQGAACSKVRRGYLRRSQTTCGPGSAGLQTSFIAFYHKPTRRTSQDDRH